MSSTPVWVMCQTIAILGLLVVGCSNQRAAYSADAMRVIDLMAKIDFERESCQDKHSFDVEFSKGSRVFAELRQSFEIFQDRWAGTPFEKTESFWHIGTAYRNLSDFRTLTVDLEPSAQEAAAAQDYMRRSTNPLPWEHPPLPWEDQPKLRLADTLRSLLHWDTFVKQYREGRKALERGQ